MATNSLAVEARAPDDQTLLATGKLALIGDAIDRSSGTIPLKAVFDNPDLKLWPGQFVNARLVLNTLPDAVAVPESALLLGPDGLIAYVVKPDSTIEMRPLEVGETVVVDGQDGISDGAAVTVGASRTPSSGA